MARLRAKHGQGVACAALSLGLNVDALREMTTDQAKRAIDLSAAVRRGHAWQRERVTMHDDDYALLLAVMSNISSENPSSSSQPAAPQEPVAVVVPAVQPQEPLPPESPQSVPNTIARSRSRHA